MSEEKIIKHSENAIHILADKKKTFWEKIKEVALEIAIIVFAVSLTLWLHNWNDKRHEKQIVKNFYKGVKEDLEGYIGEINLGIKGFQPFIDLYDTITYQILKNKINTAFLDSNSDHITNTMYLLFDLSHFESFKSSGNLRLIENDSLLRDLTSLLESQIPTYTKMNDADIFDERRRKFVELIGNKAGVDSNGYVPISKVIHDPSVEYFFYWYDNILHEQKRHRLELKNQIMRVLNEVNDELKNNF